MAPMTVIPNFNVFEDGTAGRRARQPFVALEQLPAQGRKEALRHSIVITVGAPTHTDSDFMCGQQLAIIGGGILHSPIGMMEQPWLRLPASQGHPQSVQAQFSLERF